MFNLLDCTMRDGGYYNDWDFSDEFLDSYLTTLSTLEVPYIELGFRFLREKGHSGPWAYTPERLVESARLATNAKLGVMVNASEFLSANSEVMTRIFPKNSKLDFVRIACHFEEVDKASDLISFLKDRELKVGLNLMQAPQRSDQELEQFAMTAKKFKVDFLYLADSLGGATPDSTGHQFRVIAALVDSPLGIHAHDNKGLALENSIAALESGASFVDGTLMGMGRGAGNAKTEDLLLDDRLNGQAALPTQQLVGLTKFLEDHMLPLHQEGKWGPNLPYRLAASWNVHPTFVQEMITDGRSQATIIRHLAEIRGSDSHRFRREKIFPSLNQRSRPRVSSALEQYVGKSFLIVGGGTHAQSRRKILEDFCLDVGAIPVLLNDAWADTELESLRVSADENKIRGLAERVWRNCTHAIASSDVTKLDDESFSLIPRTVSAGQLGFEEGLALVPNQLSLSYALAIMARLTPDKIYLAGIEGYGDSDSRNAAIIESLVLHQITSPNVQLISISPTKMPIAYQSPVWNGISS